MAVTERGPSPGPAHLIVGCSVRRSGTQVPARCAMIGPVLRATASAISAPEWTTQGPRTTCATYGGRLANPRSEAQNTLIAGLLGRPSWVGIKTIATWKAISDTAMEHTQDTAIIQRPGRTTELQVAVARVGAGKDSLIRNLMTIMGSKIASRLYTSGYWNDNVCRCSLILKQMTHL